MPENGFMTPAETRREWEVAEKALLARRDKAQLAGQPTAEEAKLLAAADARLATAAAANQAAFRALLTAREAIAKPWQGATLAEEAAIAEAERLRERAMRDEVDERVARNRLTVTISAAGAARRAAVS
jgi:hypothetical protein